MEAVNSGGPAVVLWHVGFCLGGNPLSGVVLAKNRFRAPPSTGRSTSLRSDDSITRTLLQVLAPKVTTVRCQIPFGPENAHRLDEHQATRPWAPRQSVLVHGKKSTAPSGRRRLILRNLSRQPYGEKFHALDRSKPYTRLVHFDTYWCNARACCGFASVLFTTHVWTWGSWRNTTGLRGLATSDCWVSVLIHSNSFIRWGDIWLAG